MGFALCDEPYKLIQIEVLDYKHRKDRLEGFIDGKIGSICAQILSLATFLGLREDLLRVVNSYKPLNLWVGQEQLVIVSSAAA